MLQDLCFGFGVSLFPLGFFWWLYLVLIFLFFGSTIVKNGWKMILLFFQGFWKSKVKIKLILCYSCTVWCMYCASFHSLFSVRLSFLFFFLWILMIFTCIVDFFYFVVGGCVLVTYMGRSGSNMLNLVFRSNGNFHFLK